MAVMLPRVGQMTASTQIGRGPALRGPKGLPRKGGLDPKLARLALLQGLKG